MSPCSLTWRNPTRCALPVANRYFASITVIGDASKNLTFPGTGGERQAAILASYLAQSINLSKSPTYSHSHLSSDSSAFIAPCPTTSLQNTTDFHVLRVPKPSTIKDSLALKSFTYAVDLLSRIHKLDKLHASTPSRKPSVTSNSEFTSLFSDKLCNWSSHLLSTLIAFNSSHKTGDSHWNKTKIVIGVGSKALPYIISLKLNYDTLFLVQIPHPRSCQHLIDTIICPKHDQIRFKRSSNIIYLSRFAALHPYSTHFIHKLASSADYINWLACIRNLKNQYHHECQHQHQQLQKTSNKDGLQTAMYTFHQEKIVAVLIGAPILGVLTKVCRNHWPFSSYIKKKLDLIQFNQGRQLGHALINARKDDNAILLITTSPRTSSKFTEGLKLELQKQTAWKKVEIYTYQKPQDSRHIISTESSIPQKGIHENENLENSDCDQQDDLHKKNQVEEQINSQDRHTQNSPAVRHFDIVNRHQLTGENNHGHSDSSPFTPSSISGRANEQDIENHSTRARNFYSYYLAAADAVLVTNDSANMISEAVAFRKPVYLYRWPTVEKGTSYLLPRRSRRLEWYLEELKKTHGCVADFDGDLRGFTVTTTDASGMRNEVERALRQVYRKYQESVVNKDKKSMT